MKLLITLLLFIGLCYPAQAQPEFDDDVTDAPINGITILVVVTGIGLGTLKMQIKTTQTKKNT